MSFNIYLVEDEENLNHILTSYLKKEGWNVQSFLTGEEAKSLIGTPPHLWILDIMLPDIDGYQLIREIKTVLPDIPVIFISARDEDIDRILGLEMGSDDYLAKPFLPRELVIRAQKLLARIYGNSPKQPNVLHVGPYTIDLDVRTVYMDGESIDLTSKELDLLVLLAQNQGQAFSREQILNHIWGEDYFGTDRVVDDLVRRLRKKLPELRIETIYGYGYRMTKS
jgi:two-component system, OmpR family, response regulator CssR